MENEEVKAEETKTETVEKPEETKTEAGTETVTPEEEAPKGEAPAETEKPEQPAEQPAEVQEADEAGNGIALTDLALRADVEGRFLGIDAKISELESKMAAMEAKYNAAVDENTKLADKVKYMSEKYEEHDFGGYKPQGVPAGDKHANDTFAEYAKQYM